MSKPHEEGFNLQQAVDYGKKLKESITKGHGIIDSEILLVHYSELIKQIEFLDGHKSTSQKYKLCEYAKAAMNGYLAGDDGEGLTNGETPDQWMRRIAVASFKQAKFMLEEESKNV